ncbi:sigma 54-interacting transcriptional regulator [Hyalangium gracile]|uniref:sigma 54-interacting transcriptional regulator n=1 Tax=Hyalangium gracile TaxID=394092 RepID=UPI001CCC67D1|nr:sigma 54-interacting transcriptional regulator [Hyalangium gracile]
MSPEASGTVEAAPSNAASRMLVRQFRMRIIAGPDTGGVHASQGARVVIGTDESADVRLRDRTVSRFHCEIALVDGQAVLKDPGSRNGTLVDGVPVFHAPLRDGSVLTLGHTQLRLEFGPEHISIVLSERERFGTMVGRASSMRALFAMLERVAPTDATVLIEGETGTGKEAVAESIHLESTRSKGPFIVVDCGAVPHDLLESELFGHERGSFTGATNRREGAFEAASGGTLFLDEIGELSSDLQPKLLRALERREIKRVGTNQYLPIDVRVVAATNRNLRAEVNAKRFRSDLFYRLAVVQVALPPLKERTEDLPLLVEHILTSLGASQHPEAPELRTAEFMRELARHAWPGNVRELRNYLERCLALRERQPLSAELGEASEETGVPICAALPLRDAREQWTRYCEQRYLTEVLRTAGNNVTAAARAAGVDRIHFYRLLWRHGLR